MKENSIIKRILIILILLLFIINPIIYALDYPALNSKIVEIYDLNNKEVVYEINSKEETSIASLTKIVTTITAIETIPDLDKEVVITKTILDTVRWDASIAGLRADDRLTYRDLLYASMLPSGADATNSIAILSSGSINRFVNKMNDLASKLELKHTHFVNVTGLDAEGHYSTADDMRIILEYALQNELFKEIYTTREYRLKNGLLVKSTINKYGNNLDTSKILGSKTGYTGDAGYCLSSLSDINGHQFIIIVLNAEHKNDMYFNVVDTVDLIEFLSGNFQNQILIKKNDIVKTIPVKLSKQEEYEIHAKEDISLYLPSDYDKHKIRIEYDGLAELSFLNEEKSNIGKVSYYYDDKLITTDDVILESKIDMSITKILGEYYYVILIIIIVIILFYIYKNNKKKRRKKIVKKVVKKNTSKII